MISVVRIHWERGASARVERRQDAGEEWLEVTHGGNASFGRNLGARAATGSWLFFLDADCELPSSGWRLLRQFLAGKDASSAAVFGLLYAREERRNVSTRAYNWIQRSWVRCAEGNLLGGALIVAREFFQRSGGFDESVAWAGEETEWLRRAEGLGARPELIPGLEVLHQQNLSLRGFFHRAYAQGMSRGFHGLASRTRPVAWRYADRLSPQEAALIVPFFVVSRWASWRGARAL